MKREQLSEIISNIDDQLIAEAYHFNPKLCKYCCRRVVSSNVSGYVKKRVITFPMAAILVIILGVTAFAIGINIHENIQEILRERLQIDDNIVVDYDEAFLSEESTASANGIMYLSTVNDGQFQKIFINVSPVEPEIVHNLGKATVNEDGSYSHYEFRFTENDNSFGIAWPPVLQNTNDHTDFDSIIWSAYDEDTKTITLECDFSSSMISDKEPINTTVSLVVVTDYPSEHITYSDTIQIFGTITVNPTESTVRSFMFSTPYIFINDETNGAGKIIGVNLSSFNVDILVIHENMETMYQSDIESNNKETAISFEERVKWLNVIDTISKNIVLEFSDGTNLSGFGVISITYENGMVFLHCGLGNRSINVNDLVGITIENYTLWKK